MDLKTYLSTPVNTVASPTPALDTESPTKDVGFFDKATSWFMDSSPLKPVSEALRDPNLRAGWEATPIGGALSAATGAISGLGGMAGVGLSKIGLGDASLPKLGPVVDPARLAPVGASPSQIIGQEAGEGLHTGLEMVAPIDIATAGLGAVGGTAVRGAQLAGKLAKGLDVAESLYGASQAAAGLSEQDYAKTGMGLARFGLGSASFLPGPKPKAASPDGLGVNLGEEAPHFADRNRTKIAAELGVPETALKRGQRWQGPQQELPDLRPRPQEAFQEDFGPLEAASDELATLRREEAPITPEAEAAVYDVFNESIKGLNKKVRRTLHAAREGVAYTDTDLEFDATGIMTPEELDAAGLPKEERALTSMPDTGGIDPRKAAPRAKFKIADDALLAKIAERYPEADVSKASAFTVGDTIYISKSGVDKILQAKSRKDAVKQAKWIIAHEFGHVSQRGDIKDMPKRPGKISPTGHWAGLEGDDLLRDVEIGARTPTLEGMIPEEATAAMRGPAIKGAVIPRKYSFGASTFAPQANELIEAATGKGAGVGGKKFRPFELAKVEGPATQAQVEPFQAAGGGMKVKTDVEGLADDAYNKIKDLPRSQQPSALKAYLDAQIRANVATPADRSAVYQGVLARQKGQPSPSSVEARIAAAKAESAARKVEPAANQAEVDAIAERQLAEEQAKLQTGKGGAMPEPPGMREDKAKMVTAALGRGHRSRGVDIPARQKLIDHLLKRIKAGEAVADVYRDLDITPEQFYSFAQTITTSKNPEHDALKVGIRALSEAATGRVRRKTGYTKDTLGLRERNLRGEASIPQTPAGTAVGAIQKLTTEAKQAARAARLEGKDPEAIRAAAAEVPQKLSLIQSLINKFKTTFTPTQMDDMLNQIKGAEKEGQRAQATAERAEGAATRRAAVLTRQAEREAALQKRLEGLTEAEKVQEEIAELKRRRGQPAAEARVEAARPKPTEPAIVEPGKPAKDIFEDLAEDEELKGAGLRRKEAPKAMDILRKERERRILQRILDDIKYRKDLSKSDKRSIAQRETEKAGGGVTPLGAVKGRGDVIGKLARELKRGKRKPVKRVTTGLKIATAADVAEWEARRKKGDRHLQVGEPIPGSEVRSPRPQTSEWTYTRPRLQAGEGKWQTPESADIPYEAQKAKVTPTTERGKPGVLAQPVSEAQLERAIPNYDVLPEEMKIIYRREFAKQQKPLAPAPREATPAKGPIKVTPEARPPKEEVPLTKEQIEYRQKQLEKAEEKKVNDAAWLAEKKAEVDALLKKSLKQRGRKYPPFAGPGTPQLTAGAVSREGKTIDVPFRVRRLMSRWSGLGGVVKDASDLSRVAKVAKDVASGKTTIEASIKNNVINRAQAAELRGMDKEALQNFSDEVGAQSAALKNVDVEMAQKDKAVYEAGKRKYVAEQTRIAMEEFDLLEDRLSANGMLHTTKEEMTSRKKYKGGFKNLVEDYLDGKQIDVEDEYYINPKEKATLRRAIEAKTWRDYDAEIASSEEAPSYMVRPELAEKRNIPRPFMEQMPRGGKSKIAQAGVPRKEISKQTSEFLRQAEGKPEAPAKTVESTTAEAERYPGWESWGSKAVPHRLLEGTPLRAKYQGGKGGKPGAESGGAVGAAMAKAASGKITSSKLLTELVPAAESATPISMTGRVRELATQQRPTREEAAALRIGLEKARAERVGTGAAAPPRIATPAINASRLKEGLRNIIKTHVKTYGDAGREAFQRDLDRMLAARRAEGNIRAGQTTLEFRQKAIELFNKLQTKTGVEPEAITKNRVLGAADEMDKLAYQAQVSKGSVASKDYITGYQKWLAERKKPVASKKAAEIEPFQAAGGGKRSPFAAGRKARADAGDIYAQAGEETYDRKALNKFVKQHKEALETTERVSGAIKSTVTSIDVSNPARNTLGLTARQIGHDPKKFIKNFKDMAMSYSEAHYNKVSDELRNRPSFQKAVDAGLRLSMDLKDQDAFGNTDYIVNAIAAGRKHGKLDPRRWLAEGGEKLIVGANRAYNHYQNAVMLDTFEDGMKALGDEAVLNKRPMDVQSLREMTKVINMLGNRHRWGSSTANRAANVVLFSPQMISSSVETLVNLGIPAEIGPKFLRGGRYFESPAVRRMYQHAQRNTMIFGASVLGLTYLAAASSGLNPEIERNPLSNDFGKVRIGHTTVNPWGPYQQYIRTGAQIAVGKTKLRGSGRVQSTSRSDILARAARGKLAPLAGLGASVFEGKTGAGREVRTVPGLGRAMGESLLPISPSDIWDIYGENPKALGTYLSTLALVGVGVQSGVGSKSWIEDRTMSETDVRVSDEIRRLKLEPPRIGSRVPLKGRNVVGQRLYYSLSSSEREKFTNQVMPIISSDIDKFISSDRYKAASDKMKARILFKTIQRENRRYSAAKRLKKEYAGATPVNQWWSEEE